MDRRKFCKIFSLAAAGAAIAGGAALTPRKATPMLRCRVTVIRRNCFADLQSRYLADPETGRCSHFTEGQTFEVADASECPRGFCPHAWKCIRAHVASVLTPGVKADCGVSTPEDGAVIACCNDGTRPVVFKIEPLA